MDEIDPDEIERLCVESDREPDEVERLLAAPPAISPVFIADGLTFSAAQAHPTLGPLLEALPDRLYWSRGKPEETDAEGIELCLLAHAFAVAGHPIRSLPPIRELALRIHDRGKNRRAPRITALWRRLKGLYGHYWGQLTIAETLHGTDVLGEHFEVLKALILAAKRKHVPADIDESDLDDFFRRVTERAVRAAMRYDRAKGAFLPYAFKFVDGAARDWRAEYFGFDLKTGERHGGRSKNISIKTPVGADENGPTIGDGLVDETTEWHPEDEFPTLADRVIDPRLTAGDRALIAGLRAHGGRSADYARAIGKEPAAVRQHIHRIKNKL